MPALAQSSGQLHIVAQPILAKNGMNTGAGVATFSRMPSSSIAAAADRGRARRRSPAVADSCTDRRDCRSVRPSKHCRSRAACPGTSRRSYRCNNRDREQCRRRSSRNRSTRDGVHRSHQLGELGDTFFTARRTGDEWPELAENFVVGPFERRELTTCAACSFASPAASTNSAATLSGPILPSLSSDRSTAVALSASPRRSSSR